MKLNVFDDHQAIAVQAAKEIAAAIDAKKGERFVLGLATGATMEPVYAKLIKMHQNEGLSFSNVVFFNLDNYVGLAPNDRNNYDEQLRASFLRQVDAKEENICLVSSATTFDHGAYENAITNAGGIDIQLLGVGRTGHIGFNEVGSGLNSLTREVELSIETKMDNGKFFNQINKQTNKSECIPLKAHTRGIAPILEASTVMCLASGHGKAKTINEMFQQGEVNALPVRALTHHSNVRMFVDKEALSLFNHDELITHCYLSPEDALKIHDASQFRNVTLSLTTGEHRLTLSPNFDFYNPKTMDINEPFNASNPAHLADLSACLTATRHLCIGAHPDDAEIMAGPMMMKRKDTWLTLILTNGAAANNTLNGKYSELTVDELTQLRQHEQRLAAQCARVPLIMCKCPTPSITGDMGIEVLAQVRSMMAGLMASMTQLEHVYGHNPMDTHDTHVNTLAEQIEALRTLSAERLATIQIWGMEVWGTLHVAESRLLKVPVENKALLEAWYALISFYESQIESQGRDYAKATIDRACGNAGYHTHPHGVNPSVGLLLAMDLTDLVQIKTLSIKDMVSHITAELSEQITLRTQRLFKNVTIRTTNYVDSAAVPIRFFSQSQSVLNTLEPLNGLSSGKIDALDNMGRGGSATNRLLT